MEKKLGNKNFLRQDGRKRKDFFKAAFSFFIKISRAAAFK
jgi:hypothetical protein